jgi:membrane protein implicated in regulation of membrane protease activity
LTTRRPRRLAFKRVLFIISGSVILVIMTVILSLSVLAYGLSGFLLSFTVGGLLFVVGLALVVMGFRKAEHEEDEPANQSGTTEEPN